VRDSCEHVFDQNGHKRSSLGFLISKMLTLIRPIKRVVLGSPAAPKSPRFGNTRVGIVLVVLASLLLGFGAVSEITMKGQSKRLPALSSTAEGISGSLEQGNGSTEEHGLSQKAEEITRFFGFPITNSMIVSWIVALALIAFAQIATRNMKQVPQGAQNFLEWVIEGVYRFLQGILGPHLTERTFWFFATAFIIILATNWAGLIPGVGSVGWGRETAHGFRIDHPLFRGGNADLNMTLAMALVFFASWIYWAMGEIGFVGFFKELFGPKGESTGLLKVLLVIVFFVAGCLEVISILFRPVSLSFRLYGNIFAGENMLEAMAKLVPHFGWLVQIPFYFLELLMGLVQAMVFTLLTAVFTLLICQHEEAGPARA
jgi:F-type H+-transporting ATPase subunit a